LLQVFTVRGGGQQRLGGHVQRQAILHFHCVVIDGVFDSAAGGIIFSAGTRLDVNAIIRMARGQVWGRYRSTSFGWHRTARVQ